MTIMVAGLLSACGEYRYEAKQVKGYDRDQLIHIVLLDLKEGTDKEDRAYVIEQLWRLKKIKGVKGLTVNARAETDDPRALLDYDLSLQMAFDASVDMESYSIDPVHLEVREKIKAFLARPPRVLDYTVLDKDSE